MTVQDVMTTPAVACKPGMNLAEATALFWENGCGALPITSETGELIGIVTDRDICIALGTRNVRSSDLHVQDVAHDHLLSCKRTDDIHTALQRMRDGKVRRLPVIDEDSRLAGIISMDDIVLNAQRNGRTGDAVSYGDAISTLQAIYTRDDRTRGQSTAA